MDTNNTTNSLVIEITKISPRSIKLVFFAIPPFHLLYLYAVALVVQNNKTLEKRTLFLYVLSLLVASVILCAFFLINLPGVFTTWWLSGQLLLFFYGILSLYVMLLIHLTLLTVSFDRQKASHRYFEFTDIDYFTRFLTLLLLPFTIWWFQAKLQQSQLEEAKSEPGDDSY